MRVTLIAAQSVDGFITYHDRPGSDFTSPADKSYFRQTLLAFDCSICGAETYRASRSWIRRGLAVNRRRVVLTRRPEGFAEEAVPGRLEFTDETPAALLSRLEALGHQECALLGGAQIHTLFLQDHRVDRLWLTLEPRLFGAGTPLVAGAIDLRLTLERADRLDGSDTLLVQYHVQRATA